MAKLPDFSKNLPEGWEDQSVFTFKGPDVDNVAHFLTLLVDRRAGDAELDEYAEEHIDMELEALPGMTVLSSGVKTLPGGAKPFLSQQHIRSQDRECDRGSLSRRGRAGLAGKGCRRIRSVA